MRGETREGGGIIGPEGLGKGWEKGAGGLIGVCVCVKGCDKRRVSEGGFLWMVGSVWGIIVVDKG